MNSDRIARGGADSIPEYQDSGRCDRCKDWIRQIFRMLPNNTAICHNCLVILDNERGNL